MKTTFQGVLLEVGEETAQGLDRLMRKYGFMVRYAFKRLLESGTKVGELERILAAETELPLRYAKDAAAEAGQLIIGQKVLVKEHWQLWQRREKKTAARIHKIARQDPTSRKLPGLRSKLEKQQRKAAFYQQHAEQSTFPPVIFGSRELYLSQFKEGVNQAAWRQEWDDARNGAWSQEEIVQRKETHSFAFTNKTARGGWTFRWITVKHTAKAFDTTN